MSFLERYKMLNSHRFVSTTLLSMVGRYIKQNKVYLQQLPLKRLKEVMLK